MLRKNSSFCLILYQILYVWITAIAWLTALMYEIVELETRLQFHICQWIFLTFFLFDRFMKFRNPSFLSSAPIKMRFELINSYEIVKFKNNRSNTQLFRRKKSQWQKKALNRILSQFDRLSREI